VRLWTVQNEFFWERLEAVGEITADLALVAAGLCCEGERFRNAYEWLARRMDEKIGGRPLPGAMPLWAWWQWCGETRARPDLRASGHLPKGERGVRIEFEIDPALVVLSDFNLWHFPLNYWYIGESEEDSESFDAELAARGLDPHARNLPGSVRRRIEGSWERVFDLDSGRGRSEKCVQATLWRISLDTVAGVKKFVAR